MTGNGEGMTEKASVTINGEPAPYVESFEWVPAPAPEMIYPKVDPEIAGPSLEVISKMASSPGWFQLIIGDEIGEVILGWIRDIKIMGHDKFGCNPVRAHFVPNPAFDDMEGGFRRDLYPNTLILLYDTEGKCKESHFVKE